jgi:hypothetical protein
MVVERRYQALIAAGVARGQALTLHDYIAGQSGLILGALAPAGPGATAGPARRRAGRARVPGPRATP